MVAENREERHINRRWKYFYALTFTIKMSKMSGCQLPGYFEYVVPPLEGLWWSREGRMDLTAQKSSWLWTSMIRQPDFATEEVFLWAVEEYRKKKPEMNVSSARFLCFHEGLCVQMMYIGSYGAEGDSLERIEDFIAENGLISMAGSLRKYHEIYLSDPRRTAMEKLKTVLRLPVKKDVKKAVWNEVPHRFLYYSRSLMELSRPPFWMIFWMKGGKGSA